MAERRLTVAALQAAFGHDMKANIAKTEGLIREAARSGAQIVLPPELFQGIYFPTHQHITQGLSFGDGMNSHIFRDTMLYPTLTVGSFSTPHVPFYI